MTYTFTRTGAQIEEIHNTVEDPKSNTQFSDDIRTIAGEYRGLWPDTGGSANKGDTYQTQVSGTGTGQYFTALQNTTIDPVGDDVNWREVVSKNYVDDKNQLQDEEINQNASSVDSLGGRVSTNEVDISALQSGQGSGVYGYATRSDLESDLTPPDQSIGMVTNDPTVVNNTNYRKVGASGSGSWTQGDSTLSAQAYQKATANELELTKQKHPIPAYKTTYFDSFTNLNNPDGDGANQEGFWSGITWTSDSSYRTTSYMEVKPGDEFYFHALSNFCTAFDAGKTPLGNISGVPSGNNSLMAVIPDTVGGSVPAFIMCSNNTSVYQDSLAGIGNYMPYTNLSANMVPVNEEIMRSSSLSWSAEVGRTPHTAQIDGGLISSNTAQAASTTYMSSFKNLVNVDDPDFGAAGFYSAGLFNASATWRSSERVKIKPNTRYVWRGQTDYMALFDENLIQLPTNLDGATIANGYSALIPATHDGKVPAYATIATLASHDIGTMAISEGDSIKAGTTPFNVEYPFFTNESLIEHIQDIASSGTLNGKKWAAMGDSITNDPVSYVKQIVSQFNMTEYDHSEGGATLTTVQAGKLHMATEYLNVPSDSDFITVAAGTNDNGIPYGDMTSRDTVTIYGACHTIFAGLSERHPNAKIGIIGILPRAHADETARDELRTRSDIIKEVAEYYSLPYLDIHRNSLGLDANIPARRTAFIPDGLHPNEAGHALYARRVIDFLSKM